LGSYAQSLDELDEALAELDADTVSKFTGEGEVFFQPDKKPQPKTTMTNFYHQVNEFVKENYPVGISSFGRVYVEFVVEKDGTLTNFNVVDGLENSVNTVVVNAVKATGDWIPGENGIVKVRSFYKQPIMVDKELIQKR